MCIKQTSYDYEFAFLDITGITVYFKRDLNIKFIQMRGNSDYNYLSLNLYSLDQAEKILESLYKLASKKLVPVEEIVEGIN